MNQTEINRRRREANEEEASDPQRGINHPPFAAAGHGIRIRIRTSVTDQIGGSVEKRRISGDRPGGYRLQAGGRRP